MRRAAAMVLAAGLVFASGCGSDPAPSSSELPPPRKLTAAQARPPAPLTAGALQEIPDVAPARRRLAFADLDGLDDAPLPVAQAALLKHVLGAGAAAAGEAGSGTAVQVGERATVLANASGREVVGARGALARELAHRPPESSAITPAAQSAVQSCLGQTLAQTILGPATVGGEAALGVGLAESRDPPAGVQLRICGAPHYVHDLYVMERALKREFGALPGDAQAVIGQDEIGERRIVAATVPVRAIAESQLLRMLAGGPALRKLSWR